MGRSTLAATSGKCSFIHVPPHSSGTTTKPFYRGGNRFRPARAEAEKEDHWLKGSPWTFLTSKSHRHSIKNHAASTCKTYPSLRTFPHSHRDMSVTGRGEFSKDTYSHRGGEGTKPCRVLQVCPGVWTMHGKTNKAPGRRLPRAKGKKTWPGKKKARETERTFCDCNSQRSRERCKGP